MTPPDQRTGHECVAGGPRSAISSPGKRLRPVAFPIRLGVVKVKSLIPDVSLPPDFEKRLLNEIGVENIRAELRAALNAGPVAQPKPRRRTAARRSAKTELLYTRIRGIPLKGVSLKDFCQRCDNMQSTFPVPKYLRDDGCPAKWFDAWNDPDWRRKIHDLRQNAWRD